MLLERKVNKVDEVSGYKNLSASRWPSKPEELIGGEVSAPDVPGRPDKLNSWSDSLLVRERKTQKEERERQVLRLFFAAFTLSFIMYLNSRFQIALSGLNERRE
jgi:hypothetical protein